jgi:hypothetical protein
MAQFIVRTPRPPKNKSANADGDFSGFEAMGRPIPFYRQQAGYEECKSMGLDKEDSHNAVAGMSEQLERDKPYEAMKIGMKYLDLTGTYRLMATLLTAEEKVA